MFSFIAFSAHWVFSTKDRWDAIPGELLEGLRLYCVGIGKNHDIPVLSPGGTAITSTF
jgi:hypothetical protein